MSLHRVVGLLVRPGSIGYRHRVPQARHLDPTAVSSGLQRQELLTEAGARVPTFLSVSPVAAGSLPGALGLAVTDLIGQKRSEAETATRESCRR